MGDGFQRNNEWVHYSFESVSLYVKQSFFKALKNRVDLVNLRPKTFLNFFLSKFRGFACPVEFPTSRDYSIGVIKGSRFPL
jgi:hypothetical protein